MKRIVIITNGNQPSFFIREIQQADMVIGVDRAAYWLIQNGIVPSVAIGDFDSTKRGELAEIKKRTAVVLIYSAEKNYTDTDLAVEYACKQKPSEIIIYGATGTRLDHELGTLFLLLRCYKRGIYATLRNETNEVIVVGRGRTILYKREGSRYISVIPITDSIEITLRHFKYNIVKQTIYRAQTRAISNEFTGRQAEIIIHRGRALVIQSRD